MWTLLPLTMFSIFVMHQVVASAKNDCGNTSFSGREGVITSPNFPLPYPRNISCTYSIDVGRNNSVQLRFIDFDLEEPYYAHYCNLDWLLITCNETDDENLDFRRRYCGTELPRTSLRFFNCPVVKLEFFSDSIVNGGGFAVEYTVFENSTSADSAIDLDCGDSVFTSSSGFIHFPVNPTEYSARVNCNYTISTTNASTFSLNLALWKMLDSLIDCNRDYITIGCLLDGKTELDPNTSTTVCSLTDESHIVHYNCNMVKISLRSSHYNFREPSGVGLLFTIGELDEDCGVTFFSGPTGVVSSPNYHFSRPHSFNCVYRIDVDRTKTVTLESLSFRLEGRSVYSSKDICRDEWLTVNCSCDDSLVADPSQFIKYCGEKRKPLILRYSNCDSLTLNFVGDSFPENGRFLFRYTITSAGYAANDTTDGPDEGCGNTSFTGPVGFISSPRFPQSYPNNLDCLYSLDVDRTKLVVLQFFSFSVEGISYSDYLDTCNHDWLLISCLSNGSEVSSHQNKRFCGEKTAMFILSYSNCDSLTLNFVTDFSFTMGGFKLRYAITPAGQSGCGNTLLSGPNGVVTSPRYPFPYPHNMRCTYFIDVGRNSSLLLNFHLFALESPDSPGHCKDWLTISCNETTKANPNNYKKYCGSIHWTNSMRFVDCPSLVLEFFSDSSINGAGFVIVYTVVENSNTTQSNSELDCGKTMFRNSRGVIHFPSNPTNYLTTVNCTYTISANRLSYMWIERFLGSWTKLLHSLQDCDTDSLTVGCVSEGGDIDLNPNTTKVFCDLEIPLDRPTYGPYLMLFEDCRTLKLSIRSNNYDYIGQSEVHFATADDTCGNTFFSELTGTVSSSVIFPYRKIVHCQYTVDSGQPNSFAMEIDHLHFGDSYFWAKDEFFCPRFWLTITCLLNGTSVAHPLADRRICKMPYATTARFSACDSVLFNYSGDLTVDYSGFWINYRIGVHELDCGTTLFTNSSGVISLPRNPTEYPATVNCTYTISIDRTSDIWIEEDLSSDMELFRSFQNCDRESLTIGCVSEGETELNPNATKKLCRRQASPFSISRYDLLFSDCRTLTLSIRSDTYIYTGDTFRIPFSVIELNEICGNATLSAPNGIIYSRELPYRFSRRVNCLYTLDIGQVNSFVFSIDRLNLESFGYDPMDLQCVNGWLTITCLVNGTSMAHPLANRRLCVVWESMTTRFPACDSVLFNFSKESVSRYWGYSIRYRIGDYELDCGSTMFTNSSGVISLPENPTNFPATVNCTYTISTDGTGDILFKENILRLYRSFKDCDKEGLTIGCVSEGETELNPNKTWAFCGRDGPSWSNSEDQLIFYDCQTLNISIRSYSWNYRWALPYPFTVLRANEICGNTSFSAPNGIISSPRMSSLYPKRINCLYVIESGGGHINTVILGVDRINHDIYRWFDWGVFDDVSIFDSRRPPLQESFDRPESCKMGWLTITCLVNGTSKAHPIADRRLCESQQHFVARFPACRSVLLNFSSDYTLVKTGFTIRYRMGDYDPECGNTSFSGPNGVITSPLLPLSNPHNLDCLYSIAGVQSNAITLSFLSFSLDGRSRTVGKDYCAGEWLTVSCFSDESVMANILASRRYCGIKTIPLTFEFPSCAIVVLNFRMDSSESHGGFKVRYTVRDTDLICGSPIYARPSGVITIPWNYTHYDLGLDCNYVINATEASSILLTIWSISLQSLVGANCKRDWLLITCIDGRSPMNLNVTHNSCDNLNFSTQITFPGCTAISVMSHRDVQTTGRTFRIEYTVTGYGDNVLTTELPATSISTTESVREDRSCATGCKSSSDSTNCGCLSDNSQTAVISVSTETRTANCEVGCNLSEDGTTCDCSTTHSGDAVADTQKSLSGEHGHSVGITLTVILVITGVICLGAFLLFRRHRKKKRSEMLLHDREEERGQLELEACPAKSARRDHAGDASK